MTTEEFFNTNPLAPYVLRVGDDLYLASAEGAARSHANRIGAEVEKVINPSQGPDDWDDAAGPDDLYEEPVEGEVQEEQVINLPPLRATTYGKKTTRK